MALTILQSPSTISTTFNPIHYLVSSDYAEETNFRYIYNIHTINDISVKYTLPYPLTYGKIDIHKILKPYLKYDFEYSVTGSTATSESIIQYDNHIGYSSTIHNMTPLTTGVKYVINATDEDFDPTDFIMNGSGRFLTNSPTTINLYKNDYYTLNYLNGNFTEYISYANKLAISYTGSTSYITLSDYLHTPTGLESVGEMLQIVGVGPKNLNITGGTYSVWLVNSSNTKMSEVITFNIKEYGKFGGNQIAFLNRLGGFSYFTFTGKQYTNTKLERFNYLKNKYDLDGTEWVKVDNVGGYTNYSNHVETEYIFNSDYIDQPTFDFMEELFTSPAVYWITDEVKPIVITDTDWFNKKKINEKVISFSIKAVDAYNKKVKI